MIVTNAFQHCLVQWPLLDEASDLLASAPDDEIMAEMLLVQSELAQQVRDCSERAGTTGERLSACVKLCAQIFTAAKYLCLLQMAINRYRGAQVLLRALSDVPSQRAKQEARLALEADISTHYQVGGRRIRLHIYLYLHALIGTVRFVAQGRG